MDVLSLGERRNLLLTMCGVVSEHTGRMCTRSLRCPQHTDVQRKSVRDTVFAQVASSSSSSSSAAGVGEPALVAAGCDPTDKDKEIDVDTWEEGDSLASLLTAQVSRWPNNRSRKSTLSCIIVSHIHPAHSPRQ